MPWRYRQLRVRDPDVFLLLPATPRAHRHARILRTIPVDHTIFCCRYPDLHHRLLAFAYKSCSRGQAHVHLEELMARFVAALSLVLLVASVASAQNPPQSDPQAVALATQAMTALTNGVALRDV